MALSAQFWDGDLGGIIRLQMADIKVLVESERDNVRLELLDVRKISLFS